MKLSLNGVKGVVKAMFNQLKIYFLFCANLGEEFLINSEKLDILS